MATVCSICGELKSDMEKRGLSFDSHIAHEHQFWKYCDFLAYLIRKSTKDFNGLETQIWICFLNRETSWVPQGTYQEPEEDIKDYFKGNIILLQAL